MWKSYLIWGGVVVVVLGAAGFIGWMFNLPSATAKIAALRVPREEMDAILASLRQQKRERPLIAVVGINDATETTDDLMPTGIQALAAITARYGERTADVVAMQLEYPRQGTTR